MPTTSSERCEDFAADARKVLSQRCAPDERHCSCVPHLRAEVERLTAAQLADEVATIARLEQEIGRLQSALGGEIAARQAADVAVEEAQLTLAAEQGRAEGAPGEGWVHYDDPTYGQIWEKRYDNGDIVRIGFNGIVHREMCRRKLASRYSTSRAAMLAADASK